MYYLVYGMVHIKDPLLLIEIWNVFLNKTLLHREQDVALW